MPPTESSDEEFEDYLFRLFRELDAPVPAERPWLPQGTAGEAHVELRGEPQHPTVPQPDQRRP